MMPKIGPNPMPSVRQLKTQKHNNALRLWPLRFCFIIFVMLKLPVTQTLGEGSLIKRLYISGYSKSFISTLCFILFISYLQS